LKEVIDYSESAVCRRKQILHYFGEDFDATGCNCMLDNCNAEKTYFEAQESLIQVLGIIEEQGDRFDDDHIANVMLGENNNPVSAYKHDEHPHFGKGKGEVPIYWKSFFRQAVLENFLSKDIDNYGLLQITEKGKDYLKNPYSIKFILNKEMEKTSNPSEGNAT